MSFLKALKTNFFHLIKETAKVSYTLFKIMIPAVILVKVLELIGFIEIFSNTLEPVMSLLNLPASAAIVWATTMTTNMYTGLAIFVTFATNEPWTQAQATIIGTMMLLAHSLPVEARIAQKSGCRLIFHLFLRIGGAFILGFILNTLYTKFHYLQEPVQTTLKANIDKSLSAWAIGQLTLCIQIFIVIGILILLLKILRKIGIEKLMFWALQPVMKLLGIKKEATSITIIGMTLGLSYGGGLLINEAESGKIAKEDIFASVSLMGLCHSIIEDTLLVMAIGAHVSGILWARLVFTLLIIFILVRILKSLDETKKQRYFVCSVQKPQAEGKLAVP